MPIVIKRGAFRYKDENGVYQTINAVSNQTTDIQVARINAMAEEVEAQLTSAGELRNMIARPFSPSRNYEENDYVIQPDGDVNKLYKFTDDHPAGSWTGTDADEAILSDDVNKITISGTTIMIEGG